MTAVGARRIFLVTGGSSGIGKAASAELARHGATVVLLGHDPDKLDAAVEEIRRETGNPAVDPLLCDLASLDAVRAAAKEFDSRYGALHVLVNNAGASPTERMETPDGLEYTFVVNYLSHFLLTNLLTDLLVANAPTRVVNISTVLHRVGRIDFDDLQSRRFNRTRAYSQAKLAMVLFTYELADRLRGARVTVNCLHPGITPGTGVGSGGPAVFHKPWALDIQARLMSTLAESSARVVQLATAPSLENVTGQYFNKGRPKLSSRRSLDRDLGRQLWARSEELTGLTY